MGKYKSLLFPDIITSKRGHHHKTLHPNSISEDPFDIQTGVLKVGLFKGSTLDEVFKENPGYLIRMSYYWSSVWSVEHKAAFLYWSKLLDNKQ